MDYSSVLTWLNNQLPIYQRVGKAALNPNLDRILSLSSYLNNPHQKFKSIHIAGTNGKGSSAHMISSILQEAGFKVGMYTSPHLKDFRERIKINGVQMSKAYLVKFINSHLLFLEKDRFSFFEVTVALAFDYFANKKVDYGIIEVGLGGRLDATNIIIPELSLITNISKDHEKFLGDTRSKIANEKAGIIKPNVPVVLVERDNETYPVFEKAAKTQGAPLIVAKEHNYSTDLLGNYQKKNINGVVSLINLIPNVTDQQIKRGLANVIKNTALRGRWECLNKEPYIIADVAHNEAGLELVMKQLISLNYDKIHIVFGVVNDKNIKSLINYLPKVAQYYLCEASVPRAMNINYLAEYFSKAKLNYSKFDNVKSALENAKLNASKNDVIYIGGSLFVVAEILP